MYQLAQDFATIHSIRSWDIKHTPVHRIILAGSMGIMNQSIVEKAISQPVEWDGIGDDRCIFHGSVLICHDKQWLGIIIDNGNGYIFGYMWIIGIKLGFAWVSLLNSWYNGYVVQKLGNKINNYDMIWYDIWYMIYDIWYECVWKSGHPPNDGTIGETLIKPSISGRSDWGSTVQSSCWLMKLGGYIIMYIYIYINYPIYWGSSYSLGFPIDRAVQWNGGRLWAWLWW